MMVLLSEIQGTLLFFFLNSSTNEFFSVLKKLRKTSDFCLKPNKFQKGEKIIINPTKIFLPPKPIPVYQIYFVSSHRFGAEIYPKAWAANI